MHLFIKTFTGKVITLDAAPSETIKSIKIKILDCEWVWTEKLLFAGKELEDNLTLADYNIQNETTLHMALILKGGASYYEKEINIKFIKDPKDINKSYISRFISFFINYENDENEEIPHGLLKLSLLKEISARLEDNKITKLPELLSNIILILKNSCVSNEITKEEIKNVLEKIKGSNILNFSRYIDKLIDSNTIKMLLQLLNQKDLEYINDIKKRLINYNEYIKLFEKDFEERKRKSIFEFSVISLVVMEREDFQVFEKERKNCQNRVDKILYHGTGIEPISCILTGYFRKSINSGYQHGKGVYFTDTLDYCWFYGGEKDNRSNGNKIPKIGERFTFIACSVYYNQKGFRRVIDYKYTPKKNEINFAYADSSFDTIVNEPDKSKFYGTEYVIWDLEQICPFIAAKMKRNEYCVIWRDNNFSSKLIYNNEFDDIFKKFLKKRMEYIEQYAEYNVYTCETTEEALELVKRKKYNKIILISNVGSDLGGKKFIDEARKIIGGDVIALFLAYNIEHLKWIKDYNNALFSNDPNFYEEYLNCFSETVDIIEYRILSLKRKIEKHYNVKFNFNSRFLYFPNYKKDGLYSSLNF